MGPVALILALAFSLFIAIIAVANKDIVSVNYLFGRAETSLIVLILGSAIAGALAMGLFSLFRGIQNALRCREGRRQQEELQLRIKALEEEKALLEAELGRRKMKETAKTEKIEAPPGDIQDEPAGQ